MAKSNLVALLKEIHDSEAIKIQYRLETLNVNFFVFRRNFEELEKVLDVTEQPEQMLSLWDLKKQRDLDLLMREIVRLLHNFLASAKTLIEHTRILMREWYDETEFLTEYEEQVGIRFADNALAGFIEGLRNFSLHYALPLTHAKFTVNMQQGRSSLADVQFSFSLLKAGLLTWSNWPVKAKKYLESSDDDIDISAIVKSYYHQVQDFHVWIYRRLQEIHSDDLAWLDEMRKRAFNLMDDDEKRARGLIE